MASHIGKRPIAIPKGVDVALDNGTFTIKGPNGSDSYSLPDGIVGKIENSQILLTPKDELPFTKAKHGLSRSVIASMIQGVGSGFSKHLLINGTGYRVVAKGKSLEFSLGFSHQVTFPEPAGVSFELPNQNEIIIKGTDKQVVGQVAANIRGLRPPEPYKGKGIRYADEHILRKAGKAGK